MCTSAEYIAIFEDCSRCRAVRVCGQLCESHRQEGQKNSGPNQAMQIQDWNVELQAHRNGLPLKAFRSSVEGR